ncbi:MAG TPA: alpha-2-macroglobulin family protein [Silvibacterium sp.]|nr:alpha-2-macroglobulin family protein [Silvibacterium sp.]
MQSAGADQQFDTADDLIVYVEVTSGSITRSPGSSASTIDLQTEHDRGPFNGHAEVTGSIIDVSGAIIPNATVILREMSTGQTRQSITNAAGRFDLTALLPGTYEIEATALAFNSVKHEFTLRARDRAIVSATLAVGAATQTVTVAAAAPGFAEGRVHGLAGGVLGGIAAGGPVAQMAINGRVQMKMFAAATPMATAVAADGAASIKAPAPHIRSYFPEALYINPEIITDGNGVASITIPLADSITTWRMAMLASTERGALGTGTSNLKVFQDFFVDLDLPVTLTQGDRVSIPIAVYNYSGERGEISLKLQYDDWFSLVDDSSEKSVSVDSNRVGGSQFTLEAKRIGKFKLSLSARMKGAADRVDGALSRADIVVHEIEVVPNGRGQNAVFNGRLEPQHGVQHNVDFPAVAIPDASKIYVRLYPGPLSQVIEGMDSILRMPYGCFEQTSSATYPNVLALDYMKRTKKLTPEVHAKAEGFIANGYQRLLTFEVPGGGFSWFGQAPANKILTAYGLMEFSDMSKVYDVDPRLIERTQQWLAMQQQPDGSWKPDTSFINEGATNRYNSDVLRITAYIGWALENTGYHGPAVEKAMRFIESHMDAKADAYTLAVIANFAVDHDKNSAFTHQAMQLLLDARTEKDEQVWWSAEETSVYSTGASAAVETTALAVQALLKWGQASAAARKALTYITSKKDASGTWGTTQATIMALRALLLASEIGSADVRGSVEITLNGKPVEKLVLTPENNDLFHQFVFKDIDPKINSVQLRFDGTGGLAYQVVGSYFVPWDDKPVKEPLSIDVAYDRTQLAQNDIATATATIRNNLGKSANMVMVDLGIPPGFDLLTEDLQSYQEKTAGSASGRLEKFSLTVMQAILYFNSFAPDSTVTLRYRLRVKYPIRAHTFQSRVYEYYDPAVSATAKPIQLEVRAR